LTSCGFSRVLTYLLKWQSNLRCSGHFKRISDFEVRLENMKMIQIEKNKPGATELTG